MAVTEYFKKAVLARELRKLRIMMKNSLLVDPTFREFEDMGKAVRSAEGLYENLYEDHDGGELNDDKSTWTKEYMDTLTVEVVSNFSHERIDLLKRVVTYLYPAKSDAQGTKPTERQKESGVSRTQKIAGGTVAGGVVGGFIGSAAGSLILGILVGAAAIGAVVAIITNGKK